MSKEGIQITRGNGAQRRIAEDSNRGSPSSEDEEERERARALPKHPGAWPGWAGSDRVCYSHRPGPTPAKKICFSVGRPSGTLEGRRSFHPPFSYIHSQYHL